MRKEDKRDFIAFQYFHIYSQDKNMLTARTGTCRILNLERILCWKCKVNIVEQM